MGPFPSARQQDLPAAVGQSQRPDRELFGLEPGPPAGAQQQFSLTRHEPCFGLALHGDTSAGVSLHLPFAAYCRSDCSIQRAGWFSGVENKDSFSSRLGQPLGWFSSWATE